MTGVEGVRTRARRSELAPRLRLSRRTRVGVATEEETLEEEGDGASSAPPPPSVDDGGEDRLELGEPAIDSGLEGGGGGGATVGTERREKERRG